MITITKLKLSWDPVETIKNAIKEWSPENCQSEKDFENSLYDFLVAHSQNVQVQKQYGIGRSKADIVIENSILIEIKKDLNKKSAFQRLIGQIEEMLGWKGNKIILLIGATDPDFVRQLQKRASQGLFSWSDDFTIVVKCLNEVAKPSK